MLKILQARLQQYVNRELPDVQAGFREGRGTRDPSNEHPGLISFKMDWLDLLEVQGTLKSLLQHDSSKASIL